MNIGERVKKLRKEKGLNQTDLGEMVGVSFGGISAIESNRNKPTIELLTALSDFFKVSTDYLLTGKEGTDTISKEEQEIIEMYRKDAQIKEAFEAIKASKKKVISQMVRYMQPQPTAYEVSEPRPKYNTK